MTNLRKYIIANTLLIFTGIIEFFTWFIINGPGQGMVFLMIIIIFNIIISGILNLLYFWKVKNTHITFLIPGIFQIITAYFYSENELVYKFNIIIPLVNLAIGIFYFLKPRKQQV